MNKTLLINFNAIMLALSSCYAVNAESLPNIPEGKLTNKGPVGITTQTSAIQPGMAYASDSLAPAPTACFSPSTISDSGQNSTMEFNQSVDVEKLAKTLGISGDLSGGYGAFSANDTFKYLNSVKENDLSLSANYYQVVSSDKNMTYSYDPNTILNAVGKSIYNNGANPMFRLFCGDKLITSYNQGALLILSVKINFHDKTQKEQFVNTFGAGFGSFANAGIEISSTMRKYGMQGTISISGFQLGGDPTQLGKAVSTAVTQCDINNVAACQATIAGLVKYVSENFPTQFQKDDTGRIWLSPLVPLGGYTKDYSIDEFGMLLAPSYVMTEVQAARDALLAQQNKNDYYATHLNNVIKNYPFALVANYKDQLIAERNVVEKNLKTLATGVGSGAASDCFKFPTRCIAINKDIQSQLTNIEPSTISNLMAPIKYTILIGGIKNKPVPLTSDFCTGFGGYFWINGDEVSHYLYRPANYPLGGGYFNGLSSFSMTSSAISIRAPIHYNNGDNGTITFDGTNDGTGNYTGNMRWDWKYGKSDHTTCVAQNYPNPYYFEPYSSSLLMAG